MNVAEINKQKIPPGIDARLIVQASRTTILFYSKRAVKWAKDKGIPAKEGIMSGDATVITKNSSNTAAILDPMIGQRFTIVGKNANGKYCRVRRSGAGFLRTIVLIEQRYRL